MRPLLFASIVLLLTVHATAGEGTVCIAPWEAPTPAESSPNMSPETWPPAPASVFTFQIGRNIRAAVHRGESASLKDVPADRRVLVRVKLDGRPFESFWLNLRREPGQRVCLWLYPGYWHWINTGWDARHGCRCR